MGAVQTLPCHETASTKEHSIGAFVQRHKKLSYGFAALVAFFVVLWVALPYATQWYVNRCLQHVPGYEGHVGRIDLHHIFRGAYVINDIDIRKTNGQVAQPFFSADKIDANVQWSELFRGHVVAEIFVLSPRVNFVKGKGESDSQTEVDKGWQAALEEMIPFKINRLDVQNGEVHFVAPFKKPAVDIYLNNLNVEARNINNTKEKGEKYFSTVVASATTLGDGKIEINAKGNPLTKPLPEFNLSMKLEHLQLPALNPFLLAFGGFDVNRGDFELYFELHSTPKTYSGYAKPLLKNIDVLDWEKDAKKKNFVQLAWKVIVGAAVDIFKNQPKDQIATKAPFSGKWKETDVNIFAAVGNLLVNAFIQALIPGFEQRGSSGK